MMLPPPGRRGTRSNGGGKFTAVEDFARYSETKMPPPPGRRGTRSSGARKTLRWRILTATQWNAAEGDKE